MQPIYTRTIGAGGGNPIFNNIPQGFTDLKIVISGRGLDSSVTNQVYMQFNGIGASGTYSVTRLTGSGVAAFSDKSFGSGGDFCYIGQINQATSTSNVFSNMVIDIFNYSGGNNKSISVESVSEQTASFATQTLTSALARIKDPITSITLGTFGTFAERSTITIYGMSSTYQGSAPTAPTISSITDQAGFVSVAFTPASNDSAQVYAVTTNPATSTTYGAVSPIVAPVTVGTSTTLRVASVNQISSSLSTASTAITSSNNFASIASSTSPSSSVVTFNDIPQNYKNLVLRVTARSTATGSEALFMRFNDNFTSIYNNFVISGSGGNTTATTGANINVGYYDGCAFSNASQSTNVFGHYIIEILDYASTSKFKTIKMYGGYDNNGSGVVSISSGIYKDLSPISKISQIGGTATTGIASGSTFALYGMS
jgi:hypothetical protein